MKEARIAYPPCTLIIDVCKCTRWDGLHYKKMEGQVRKLGNISNPAFKVYSPLCFPLTSIPQTRKHGSKCLVHCKMGVSRSASTVIAYAMKEYGWNLDRAYDYVKERRTVTKPNPSFMRQLEEYQGILLARWVLKRGFLRFSILPLLRERRNVLLCSSFSA